jgi:hypothetical protein
VLHFPDYGTELWSHDSRNFSMRALRLQTYLAKRATAQSVACAEVQFPDYGTVLWSPDSSNCSRIAGKHCDLSTYFTKRTRAQFGACAEVQLSDYGTVM